MRRLVAFLSGLSLAACQRQPAPTAVVIDEPRGLEQTVTMGNLEHAKQLTKGFYNIEDGAWRWTQGKFSVVLQPPIQADVKGATLVAKLNIPAPLIEKLNDVTFNITVNGKRLRTAHYSRPGNIVLRLDVPPAAFEKAPAAVDFVLDKVLPPRPGDQRELGVIATSIGLERKS